MNYRAPLQNFLINWVWVGPMVYNKLNSFFFHLFLLVGWLLIYNIVVVFVIHWHESAMDLHEFPIPIPPPTWLSTRSLWVFPVHQARALVSCIQRGLMICFTLDNIHISKLFSQNIPPSPSPTESKSLFCTSVSLFMFCVDSYVYMYIYIYIYKYIDIYVSMTLGISISMYLECVFLCI